MKLGEALESYYRKSRPRYEDVRVGGLARIGEGMECEIHSFKLRFTLDGLRRALDRVVRIYEVPARDMGWLSRRHRREYLGLRWLREHGYPVPGDAELVEDSSYLGRPFLIMERVGGEPAGAAYRRRTRSGRVDLLQKLCRLYVELHSLPWQEFFDGKVRSIEGEIEEFARLSLEAEKDGFTPGWEWLMDHRPAQTSAAVVHGDFHPDNVLMDPGGKLCVIDWTQVRVTDYRFDLGWTLLLGGSAGLREKLLAGYEEARKTPVPGIAYFEAASALKRLLIFAMILEDGPGSVGLRPGTDDRIVEAMAGHVQSLYSRWCTITDCRLHKITRHLRGIVVR